MGYNTPLSLDRELPDLFSGNSSKIANTVAASTSLKTTEVEIYSSKLSEMVEAEKENKIDISEVRMDNERIRESLESLNQFIPLVNTNLVFEFDDLNEPPIIKVIDKESKELIREIPSRDLDKVAKAFGDMVDTLNRSGALFNTEI